jgi:hypothetical protein
MKFSKLFVIGSLLAAAFLFVSTANATTPTIVFAGAGSTAVFNALYDAGLSSGQCGTNLFSQGGGTYPGPFTKGGTLHDNRNGHGVTIPDDNSKVWVAFDGTAANSFTDTTVICFYIAVDSGVGVRGFLAAPRAALILSGAAGSASGNQVNGYADNVATLPQAIWNDVNVPGTACVGTTLNTCTTVTGTVINIAFSDIRPEDAQYATFRALSTRTYNGAGTTAANPTYFSSTNLGYGNWNNPYDAGAAPVLSGTSILSSFSTTAATPTYFEQVPGASDAITGQHVGQYATWPVGAIPVIIAVSNADTTAGSGLGNGVPNNYSLRNVDRFTASYAFDGVSTRTRDLTGVPSAASTALQVITREPLSGTYNTFEFSVPRTHDVQDSQEDGIWPSLAGYNPLNVKAAGSNGLRFRAVGTGEMVKAINGLATSAGLNAIVPNRIGYFFWSYGNISPLAGTGCTSTLNAGLPVSATVACTTNPGAHYLQLDGVDPLFNDTFDNPQGPLNPPTCNFAALPCPVIPFTHLNDGSYGAWNIVRMLVDPTVTSITPGCVSGICQIYNTVLTTSVAKYSDFDPATNLKVFRSHKGAGWGAQGVPANAYLPVNGTMCTTPFPAFSTNFTGQDMASDVGGAIWTISADQDYAFDYQGGLTPAAALCGQTGGANVGLVGQVQ